MLFLNECLLLFLFISLSTQSGNFWIHPRTSQATFAAVANIKFDLIELPHF